MKYNFLIIGYQMVYPNPNRNLTKSKKWLKLTDLKLFKSIETHSLGWHIPETSTHSSDVGKFTI